MAFISKKSSHSYHIMMEKDIHTQKLSHIEIVFYLKKILQILITLWWRKTFITNLLGNVVKESIDKAYAWDILMGRLQVIVKFVELVVSFIFLIIIIFPSKLD